MRGSTEGEAREGRDARDRADRAATDWLIRLQEQPDDRQLQASFEAWLGADPVHAAAWSETGLVARAIAAAPARAEVTGGRVARPSRSRARASPLQRRMGRSPRLRRISWMTAAAAAACLALVTAPDIWFHMRADAVAATGAVETVRLVDGSIVQLASGGALAIDFSGNQRRVSLLRGSAYFDIAHDAARPFRIAAGDTLTTVLGTAFEIRRQDAGVAVAVKRGLVRVSCDREPQPGLLSAGQSIDLHCGRLARRGNLAPSRIATWTAGQLVVDDKSIRDVVEALRPWHRGVILARGEGIDRRRVTGVYDLRDPDGVLDAIAAAHDANIRRVTPWLTMISVD